MADIFLSYASEDRPRAQRVATALQSLGWTVWWDRKIPAGRTFADVIEEAISASRCVIVLWSKESVGSKWVREEADEGEKGRKLIPVLLDDVKPPMGFRSIHAADLIGWEGSVSASGFKQLIADLAPLIGPPPKGPEPLVSRSPPGPGKPGVAPDRPSEPGGRGKRWVVVAAIGSIAVALGGWGISAYVAETKRRAEALEAQRIELAEQRRLADELAAKKKAELDAQEKALEQRLEEAQAAKLAEEQKQREQAAAQATREAEEERKRLTAEAAKRAQEQKQREQVEAARRVEEERKRVAEEAAKKAVSARIRLSVSDLDFGSRAVGDDARGKYKRRNVVVINLLGKRLPLKYQISGPNPQDFPMWDSDCTQPVKGAIDLTQNCYLSIDFAPSQAGPRSAVLTVDASTLDRLEAYKVTLSGTGITGTPAARVVTGDYTRLLTNNQTGDTVRIITVSPRPGTPLKSGQSAVLSFRIRYNLQSRESAVLAVSIAQSHPKDLGCVGSVGNLVNSNEVRIVRGERDTSVDVLWRGGESGGTKQAQGYLAPAVSLWEADTYGRRTGNLFASFPAVTEACFPFSS